MIRILFYFSFLLLFAVVLGFRGSPFAESKEISSGALIAPETEQAETRCGWFSNPTPGNASLFDREGEWIIGVQGGYQAEGDWGDFGRQWVKTNVNYGYGCACLKVRVDRAAKQVTRIESFRVRPLSVCRKDRALKKWGFK